MLGGRKTPCREAQTVRAMATYIGRVPSTLLPIQQQCLQFVRAKGGIKPHGKPRWIPRAPSKVFNVVPKSHIPDAEINQILRLKYAHADKMAAVTQLLWEDYLLNSDVGEAAKLSAQREEEEHRRLLALNHETNRQIALKRESRVAAEAAEKEVQIQEELRNHQDQELRRIHMAETFVASEIEDLKDVITDEESLVKAVMAALDNPVDYEYSIDLEGHIYPGRYTKATKVPPEERKVIPTPMREGQLILGIDESQRQQSNV